jgi:glycosyltransferase involved in cell wall biosynthesis
MILEKAGMLERFYTDLAGNMGVGKWLVKCGPLLGYRRAAARLAGRRIPEPIQGKTVTLGGLSVWQSCVRSLRYVDQSAWYRAQLCSSHAMGSAVIRRGFGQATHLYSMLSEYGPVVGAAKRKGLGVVTEIYIMLSSEKIVAQEQRRFPGWEPPRPDLDIVRSEFPEQKKLLVETDFAVCPSENVRRDLEENFRFAKNRSLVVPYGVDGSWLTQPLDPVVRRVLFVGTAGLRKGIKYLSAAAEQLRAQDLTYEFRIAGDVAPQIANQSGCKHLTFLGRISRERVQEEYAKADVYVLPSLAEGSAEATYEALAMGLPAITTVASGSVVRHRQEGFIVPERDATALAAAIEQVVENRPLRSRMSAAARKRACEYTLERYGERLVTALQSLQK